MSSGAWQIATMSFAGLLLLTVPSQAGPCAQDIERMQVRVDAWLNKQAAEGPSKRQSLGAQLHRQPTPGSLAEAEGVPTAKRAKVRDAIDRARAADNAGDKEACEKALAEIPLLVKP